MGSEADAHTTGTTPDRQRGKFQMNLPQRSLAQRARQPWVCPFGNEERFGHCMHLGALQEVLSEERWSLTLLGNHIKVEDVLLLAFKISVCFIYSWPFKIYKF